MSTSKTEVAVKEVLHIARGIPIPGWKAFIDPIDDILEGLIKWGEISDTEKIFNRLSSIQSSIDNLGYQMESAIYYTDLRTHYHSLKDLVKDIKTNLNVWKQDGSIVSLTVLNKCVDGKDGGAYAVFQSAKSAFVEYASGYSSAHEKKTVQLEEYITNWTKGLATLCHCYFHCIADLGLLVEVPPTTLNNNSKDCDSLRKTIMDTAKANIANAKEDMCDILNKISSLYPTGVAPIMDRKIITIKNVGHPNRGLLRAGDYDMILSDNTYSPLQLVPTSDGSSWKNRWELIIRYEPNDRRYFNVLTDNDDTSNYFKAHSIGRCGSRNYYDPNSDTARIIAADMRLRIYVIKNDQFGIQWYLSNEILLAHDSKSMYFEKYEDGIFNDDDSYRWAISEH